MATATVNTDDEILTPRTVRVKEKGIFRLARYCPERAYVELHIPMSMVVIKSVTFRISSHDQGFSDQSADKHGTIDGSATWFNACAITPVGHDRVPRRIIGYNLLAISKFNQVEAHWDREDSDENRRWLANIRGGDIIQIIPRAEYLAWLNFVQSAEIEVNGLESMKAPMLSPVASTLALAANGPRKFSNHYRSLHDTKREIRLICLNSGSFDDPISCSLIYTYLSDTSHVKYEALSYCWGDQADRSDIDIYYPLHGDGKAAPLMRATVSITSSLYEALRNLRPAGGPTRIFWIDAICINQEDLEERVKQIAIMRDIYELATKVTVWIGESDQHTKRAIDMVNKVGSRYDAYLHTKRTWADLKTLHAGLLDDNHFDAFIDAWPLFEKPYFRRTWVVQEVFNAKVAEVQCGQDVVPWQSLLRVSKCHSLTRLKATSGFKAVMPPLFSYLFEHRKIHDTSLQATPVADFGILEILIAGLDLDATDPRDKVFAMLQFGSEFQHCDSLDPRVQPDYHKSTAQVFSDLTRYWIIRHKSLRILSAIQAETGRTWQETQCVGTTVSITGRPSWSIWYRGHSNWAKSILGLSTSCPYRAAGLSETDSALVSNPSHDAILPLKGFKISTIAFKGPYPFYEPNDASLPLKKIYTEIYDPVNEQRRWARSLFSQQKSYRTVEELPHHMNDHFRAHHQYAQQTKAIECHSECFFRTDHHGLGLCVPYAQKGDVIAVLLGGNVPFVLRPVMCRLGDELVETVRYELVGECYLLDYMDGKAVREMETQGRMADVFELI